MKSKITLIILVVALVLFATLSFFFGFKYSNAKEELVVLKSENETFKNTASNTEDVETEIGEQVKVVEKLVIPEIDLNKIEPINLDSVVGYRTTSEYVRDGNVSYILGSGTTYAPMYVEDYDYQFLFKNEKYSFGDKNIKQVKYQYLGASGGYYVILFDDGTVSYTLVDFTSDGKGLEFIDTGLKDVVRLVLLGVEYENGRVSPYVSAITSDGYTHIIQYNN